MKNIKYEWGWGKRNDFRFGFVIKEKGVLYKIPIFLTTNKKCDIRELYKKGKGLLSQF